MCIRIFIAAVFHFVKNAVYYKTEAAVFFRIIIGGDQVINSKPDPEIFLRAASAMNIPPQACYVIEDSFNGIRAADAGKMIPIINKNGFQCLGYQSKLFEQGDD